MTMVLLELLIVWIITIYLLYNGLRRPRNRVYIRSMLFGKDVSSINLRIERLPDGSLRLQEEDRDSGEGSEDDEDSDSDEFTPSDEPDQEREFISADAQWGASDSTDKGEKEQ